MRRAGRGSNEQAPWRGRDHAITSALHLERGWTMGDYVKVVVLAACSTAISILIWRLLAACSTAISILIWRLQPGRPPGPHNLGSRNPGFVFPLYHYYQPYPNGSRVVRGRDRWRGSRVGNGRKIRSENPLFEVHGTYQGDDLLIDEFYIEVKLGDPPKPFYFHIDTGSGKTWVHCSLDGSTVLDNFGPNGLFLSEEDSIVKCTGATAALCRALQDNERCKRRDNYECKFSAKYGDGSLYVGVVVNESTTLPMQDKTERDVFVLLGCVLDKRATSERLSLLTDGVVGLGRCDGSLPDQLLASKDISQKVVGVCLAKEPRRRPRGLRAAGRVGYISMGMDFEEKFDQSKPAWVKLVGPADSCIYTAKLLSIVIGNRRITASPDRMDAGMALGFDTGSEMTFFRKDVYDQVLGALETFTANGEYIRVEDNEDHDESEQRVCWEYRGKKRKNGWDPLAKASPIHDFGPLNFGLEGIATTELQHLIIRPENYLAWDVAKRKLCVNIIQDNSLGRIDLGVQYMREYLFVFDIENHRFRWKPSNECEL